MTAAHTQEEDGWPGGSDAGEVPLQLLASQSWDTVPDLGSGESADSGVASAAIARRVHSLLSAEALPAQTHKRRLPEGPRVRKPAPVPAEEERRDSDPEGHSPTDADLLEALRLVEVATAKRARTQGPSPVEAATSPVVSEALPGTAAWRAPQEAAATEAARLQLPTSCAVSPCCPLTRPTRPMPQPPLPRTPATLAWHPCHAPNPSPL